MSLHHHAPELPYCRNCQYTLAAPRPVYCGHCGQETDLHPPSVREMLTEYLGHYVAFDGPLWRTLWALICLPGHLTNAYFHGQRRRYVLPLRVYLSASFVFFVGWALLPQGPTQVVEAAPAALAEAGKPARLRVSPHTTPKEAAAAAEAMAKGASTASGVKVSTKLGDCDLARPETCRSGQRWLTQLLDKAESMTFEQWKSRGRALAPYAMLAMQPIFAALLLATFAGSGRRYAEHFVFSLHSHSIWFLALLLAMATGLEGPMMFAVFGHSLAAMRRVYGLSWWSAAWRGVLLSGFYFVLLGAVALTLAALIAVTA
ncbi:MAG TPA: DUF3667 domain-containing protein [Roseateles sp.]